jgi:hypothetical protein
MRSVLTSGVALELEADFDVVAEGSGVFRTD